MENLSSTELDYKMESLTLQSVQGSSVYENEFNPSNILNCITSENTSELEQLQRERLKFVLKKQEEERNDTSFSRECLFCRKHFTGNRSLLFQHLMEDHNFHIGSPDNIVFGNEFLDVLSEKLKNLQCFYCERIFKDWMVLKEHMRKKQHKLINPRNKTYDKFYIINYLEFGKSWTEVQNEDDFCSDLDDDQEDEFMECVEDDSSYICLFCPNVCQNFESTLCHMKDFHQFDYRALKDENQLDFYRQIKLINYIRRQVHMKACILCDEQFSTSSELLNHMTATGHIKLLPEPSKWDQSVFYFPTYENDNFLCALDDEADDSSSCDEPVVLPEDINLTHTPFLNNEEIRKCLC